MLLGDALLFQDAVAPRSWRCAHPGQTDSPLVRPPGLTTWFTGSLGPADLPDRPQSHTTRYLRAATSQPLLHSLPDSVSQRAGPSPKCSRYPGSQLPSPPSRPAATGTGSQSPPQSFSRRQAFWQQGQGPELPWGGSAMEVHTLPGSLNLFPQCIVVQRHFLGGAHSSIFILKGPLAT